MKSRALWVIHKYVKMWRRSISSYQKMSNAAETYALSTKKDDTYAQGGGLTQWLFHIRIGVLNEAGQPAGA
jgi:hypothetical protein